MVMVEEWLERAVSSQALVEELEVAELTTTSCRKSQLRQLWSPREGKATLVKLAIRDRGG